MHAIILICRASQSWLTIRLTIRLAISLCVLGISACAAFDRTRSIESMSPEVKKILAPIAPYFIKNEDIAYQKSVQIGQQIKQIRPQFDYFFTREQNACYDNFFVNFCLTPLQEEQRYWLTKIKQLEIQVNAIQRQESLNKINQAIGQRLAEKPLPEKAEGLGNIIPNQIMIDAVKNIRNAEEARQTAEEEAFKKKQQRALEKQNKLKENLRP